MYELQIKQLQETNAALTDGLEKALGVADGLRKRIQELEANRDLFQARRDEAIREAERKTVMLNKLLDGQPITAEVLTVSPQRGDLVILHFSGKLEPQGMGMLVKYLHTRYPGVTFLTVGPGSFSLEARSETELRELGLISARRVDVGVQQLEAAFGAHQEALKTARQLIVSMAESIEGNTGYTVHDAHVFVEKINALLQAELLKEKGPTRERLIELLQEARSHLIGGRDGDSSRATKLADQIDDALRPEGPIGLGGGVA